MVLMLTTSCQQGAVKESREVGSDTSDYIPDPHSYSRLDQCAVTHMEMDLRIDFTRKAITGIVKYEFDQKVIIRSFWT